MELASELRRHILKKLEQKKMRLTELANDLNITVQEAHRNVARLTEDDVGLIKRGHDGTLSLTLFGHIILEQLPTFRFLSENKEYFNEHTLGDVPANLRKGLGAMANCRVINGFVLVEAEWKNIYQEAREYVHAIKAQVSLGMIESISKAIDLGIKYSYILGEDVIVPKGRSELLEQLKWNQKIGQGMIERRMANTVPVVVVLNERQASVLFPEYRTGQADLSTMFYSEDHSFHHWCLDYFKWKWSQANLFDNNKVQEI